MLERGVLGAAGAQNNAGLGGGELGGGGACQPSKASGLVGSGLGSDVSSPRLGGSGLGRLSTELGGGLSSRPGSDRPENDGLCSAELGYITGSRPCGHEIDCGESDNGLQD